MERSGERRRPDSVERVSAPLSLSFSLAWGRGEAACVWDGWVRVCSLNVPAWCAPWLEETAREKEQRRARSELSERARVPDQPCLLTPSSPPLQLSSRETVRWSAARAPWTVAPSQTDPSHTPCPTVGLCRATTPLSAPARGEREETKSEQSRRPPRRSALSLSHAPAPPRLRRAPRPHTHGISLTPSPPLPLYLPSTESTLS